MSETFNALTLAHKFVSENVSEGAFCIDATAGRGNDTAFLCTLSGRTGYVLSFDIQQEALDSTSALLASRGLENARLILDSHSEMERYAQPETADCIMFNFGWLPAGNHKIFTMPETSISAIEAGLRLLKPRGIMSLIIYYGRDCGFAERDALLEYFKTIDSREYTVIVCDFTNRPNNPSIPVFIRKDG